MPFGGGMLVAPLPALVRPRPNHPTRLPYAVSLFLPCYRAKLPCSGYPSSLFFGCAICIQVYDLIAKALTPRAKNKNHPCSFPVIAGGTGNRGPVPGTISPRGGAPCETPCPAHQSSRITASGNSGAALVKTAQWRQVWRKRRGAIVAGFAALRGAVALQLIGVSAIARVGALLYGSYQRARRRGYQDAGVRVNA